MARSIMRKLNKINITLSHIKCRIEDLSECYSSHADKEQLINYIVDNKNDARTTEP
jgi:hypothetical protein